MSSEYYENAFFTAEFVSLTSNYSFYEISMISYLLTNRYPTYFIVHLYRGIFSNNNNNNNSNNMLFCCCTKWEAIADNWQVYDYKYLVWCLAKTHRGANKHKNDRKREKQYKTIQNAKKVWKQMNKGTGLSATQVLKFWDSSLIL